MNAVIDRDDALVNDLLAQGANPDETDSAGWSALHFAALDCGQAIVEMLVKAGAALNLQDKYGNSPLWRATMSYRGKEEVISTLLRAGADPDLPNEKGISPRSLANTIANYDTARFFDGF